MSTAVNDDLYDIEADKIILECINLEKPKSFFLYAGAGSGKTRSLVEAIRIVCRDQGRRLSLSGQKIGVITYTNAACDEIKQRLEFDPRVEVSTIHAFAWSLIGGYDGDIRQWVAARMLRDISELKKAQAKGRAGSKAAIDRERSIESKQNRLAGLDAIQRFIYSPAGDNRTRDALNHAEVIAMTADFLTTKTGLRRLLVTRFPILLIDESQDTNRGLMEALLDVQAAHRDIFCLGLFGDTMQRIYADGKVGLADAIPDDWARPCKEMNHRCPTRIIELINKVRLVDDGHTQRPRRDAPVGHVRLFILPHSTDDKSTEEAKIAKRMAEVSGDPAWTGGSETIKTLALEHMMSARRFGFEAFFKPLYAIKHIRTGFLDGSGAGIGLFIREILPLVKALQAGDRFATASIIRRTSPLLNHAALEIAGDKQQDLLDRAKTACDGLLSLVTGHEQPTLREVFRHVANAQLFTIPDVLAPFTRVDEEDVEVGDEYDDDGDEEAISNVITAWRLAMEAPFDQIEKYDRYIRGVSQFDTHQGVKGLEFPRVMVIISDEEAGGFLFNYDKLFGAKDKSKTDLDNEAIGKETTIDRTRRLFYVTCSRAEQSLAVVYYASDPAKSRAAMIKLEWFKPDEIDVWENV